MKKRINFSYALSCGIVISWLVGGCKPGGNEASPKTNCRIQRYTATTKSNFSTGNRLTTYTYDAADNLVKKVATAVGQSNTGANSQTYTATNTYTYDSDGYLTTSSEQMRTSSVFNGKTTEEETATVSSYSYTNGRLAARSDKRTGPYSSSTGTLITTYEYNSAGELTKTAAGSQFWLYQNNRLVDYTGTERPYTIQNGVIVKSVFQGTTDELVVMAAFDDQQRLIKRDEYLNGQLNRSDVQTWSDAKPSSASLPPFKGFPLIIPVSSFSGQAGVLATYKSYYWNSVSKTMQQYSDDTYAVQNNAQGFITGATISSKHPLATDQDYTTTETYTYSGCQ